MSIRSIRVLSIGVTSLFFSGLISGYVPGQQRQQKERPGTEKPGAAQEERAQTKDDAPLKIGTDLVLLDVTVVDSVNKPVMSLRQDQFQVFEDKTAQKIEFFSREQVPVSVVLCIDTSGSMKGKLDTVIKSSINLAKESRSDDELALVAFKQEPELVEEFTTNIDDIIDGLQGLVANNTTAVLDALYVASDYAQKEGRNRRKAVVIVTDGLDKDSYYKFDEVVSHLRESDVQVYLIGFTSDLSKDNTWVFGRSEKEKAENLLNKLAGETGGRAFYPRELSEVHTISQQISTDLRTQYSIGYYPTNKNRDGTFRTVKVQIVNPGNQRLVARTRAGYYATREGEERGTSSKQRPE